MVSGAFVLVWSYADRAEMQCNLYINNKLYSMYICMFVKVKQHHDHDHACMLACIYAK